MKLFLTNRNRLGQVGDYLLTELDSLVSRIRGAWNVEHNEDDTHGHVHANSIAAGRIVYSGIVTGTITDTSVNNYDVPNLSTAAILRLDSSQALVSITGLRVPQDEAGAVLDGRVLVVENVTSTSTFVFECEHTASIVRNRITTPYGPPPDTSTMLRFYLVPGSLAVFIYNASKARWILQSQIKDANEIDLSYSTTPQNDVVTTQIRGMRTARVGFTIADGQISGFNSTNIPTSTRLTVTNTGLYKLAIMHKHLSSAAANRVECPGGLRYMLHPRESVTLVRVAAGWRLEEKAHQWIDVTYAAGLFTTDAGTWTVDSGDVLTLCYTVDGTRMTVAFALNTTTVAGGPTQLRIAIPNGRISAREIRAALAVTLDNGVAFTAGQIQVTAGGTTINMYKDAAGTAWAASVNATYVYGEITFFIRDDVNYIVEDHSDVAHADAAHADTVHVDVAHVDVAHGDSHGDASHSDVSHSDVAAVNTHTDSAHSDSHSDVTHVDTHSDSAHSDVSHSDTPHTDVHGDDNIPDPPHVDHTDSHFDVPHSDVSHGDAPHGDSHSDTAHTDTHSDTAHVDTHGDSPHSDVAHVDGGHSDTHSDTAPHSDVAHVDTAHADTAHGDTAHSDTGYHTDVAHSDI